MLSDVLQRYMWVLIVVTILLGTWLLADTVNAVIANGLAQPGAGGDSSSGSQRTMGARAAREPSLDDFKTVIRSRNIFDSANRAPDEEEVAAVDTEDLGAPTEDAESCQVPITVIATVPVDVPEWSIATVEDKSQTPAVVVAVAVGESITDDAILSWVDREGIEVVRNNGRRERCNIDASRSPRPAVSMNTSRGSTAKPTGEGIQRVSANKFVIAQSEVDAALNNLSSLATEARIVPYFENGQAKGFKLYSIKPKSLIAKVGIMNGDIIQKVNGYDINSPEKALQVYSLLKNENKISIDIVRNGRPKSFQYEIR